MDYCLYLHREGLCPLPMLTKLKNNNDMTFKEAELPERIYLVFDDDAEVYKGWLIDIVDVDESEDQCVFLVDDLMPQTAQLKVPCSLLDEEEMHLAGVHLYLDEEKAKQKALLQ